MKSSSSQSLQRSLRLRGHAAAMREPGNRAEELLWQRLRGGQLGVWFCRQVVLLGSCIVDFCCASARLVVEVDGGYHGEPASRRAAAPISGATVGSARRVSASCASRLTRWSRMSTRWWPSSWPRSGDEVSSRALRACQASAGPHSLTLKMSAYHVAPARRRVDARRDGRLAKAGIRVVRVAADVVVSEPKAVIAVVMAALGG